MTNFLGRLAARQIAPGRGLRPRSVSRFAAPEAEAAAEPRPLLVAPAQAAKPPSAAAIAQSTAPMPEQADLQAAQGSADAIEPRGLRSEPRAPDPGSPTEPPQRPLPAGETDTTDIDRPRNGRSGAVAVAAHAAAPSPGHPRHPSPLVPREIVRARETTTQHTAAAARSAVATVPAAAERADEPVVRITIGRIEVRAADPAPAREKRPPARPKTMSLDEYLDRRHGPRR
jgi:hypothetical protein